MSDKIPNSRKIVALRERKGWTQKRLAEETERIDPERSGINLKTVQNAENKKPSSPRTQALLALALGVNPEQLEVGYELKVATPYVAAGAAAFIVVILFFFHRTNTDDPILLPSGGVLPGTTSDVDYGSGPTIAIKSVRVSGDRFGYSLTITGSGFGTFPYRLPFHGDTAFLRIGDPSHRFEAAYLDDKFAVRYLQWTDQKIEIGDILMRSPGDDIEIGVWNPQTGRGAAWGGNIPPLVPGTPRIVSAEFSVSASRLRIRLVGVGFGNLPRGTRLSEGPYFVVGDLRYHDFTFHPGARSIVFTAGNEGGAALSLVAWRDREIDVSLPLIGRESARRMGVHLGDPICIAVRNPTTTGVTTWSGRIPPLGEHSGWTTSFNPSAATVDSDAPQSLGSHSR
jgi:transcriptional regulator with XRE-family HTH domain